MWDGHACLPLVPDPASGAGLDAYRRAGVGMVSVNIGDADVPLERQVRLAGCFMRYVRDHSDDYVFVQRLHDLDIARATGRTGVTFDVEGAHAMGDDLAVLEAYQRIGVRTMALVYNVANLVGGGCHDPVDGGLTAFGQQVVREMEEVGIVVDLSHAGRRTALDVLDVARNPVVFSHSNPRALVDHPRNIPDDLICACAAQGGVIGINGVSTFIDDDGVAAATIARHIDHVVQLVGPDHVALGLDFVVPDESSDDFLAGPDFWPDGFGYGTGMRFAGPDRLAGIHDDLFDRGYSRDAIEAIFGANLRHIAATVWR